jgi:hypothetical protein
VPTPTEIYTDCDSHSDLHPHGYSDFDRNATTANSNA